ncbi:WhiB family transcriptional regulator [Streptacidiphilus sp. N1-12]|uniref:Transcriptional regulator WhiB n=2 Tax=Streptacidiphilus alkalitolerans TaxID=3342712 RepID=A0ABV6V3E2_9ACTN
MDWRDRAACRAEDPELFFPVGNTGTALLQEEAAKQVCRRCPVLAACRQWAVDSHQESGIWGALNEEERRSLKRRHQRAARSRADMDQCASPTRSPSCSRPN